MDKRNEPELFYLILEKCVNNRFITKEEICNNLQINEDDIMFETLRSLKLVDIQKPNVYMTGQGLSTYLTISSQKQSATQSNKATRWATLAFIVSIASFIASIVFNLISIYSC